MSISSSRRAARSSTALVAVLSVAALLGGCSAQPGPAPVENPDSTQTESTPAPSPESTKNVIGVGIDPLTNGFNPHLMADDSAFTQSLAKLVLPSAYSDGVINSALLESAEIVTPNGTAKQTLRYKIREEAQWSDGTPITGADFQYLWNQMTQTPAVIDSAQYKAISSIRTSNGGKTVEVDFHTPVQDWQGLFSNLIPSHLFQIGPEQFSQVLSNTIPASGGKYMVRSIDRGRGIVELTRNDRFWGESPARVEKLQFREIHSLNQAQEMMRTGQIGFMDLTPTETSQLAFGMMPELQVRQSERNSTLEVTLSTNSKVLEGVGRRKAFASLIDVPTVARVASARSADVAIAPPIVMEPPSDADLSALAQSAALKPIRIAVDPADDQATGAAMAIVDLLRAKKVAAEIVKSDARDIAANRLPQGDVDAVISWNRATDNPNALASRYMCASEIVVQKESGNGQVTASATAGDAASETASPTATQSPSEPLKQLARSSNLSGVCDPELDQLLFRAMAGEVPIAEARDRATTQAQDMVLSVPIMKDRRIEALGSSIIGPEEQLQAWPYSQPAGAIPTAAGWRESNTKISAKEPNQ